MARLSPETSTSYQVLDWLSGTGRIGVEPARAGQFDDALRRAAAPDDVEMVIAPPATTLPPAAAALATEPSPDAEEPPAGSQSGESLAGVSRASEEAPVEDAADEEEGFSSDEANGPVSAAARAAPEPPAPAEEPPAGAAPESEGAAPVESEAETPVESDGPTAESAAGKKVAGGKASASEPGREPNEQENREQTEGAPIDEAAGRKAERPKEAAGETAERGAAAGGSPEQDRHGTEPVEQVGEPRARKPEANPPFGAEAADDKRRGRESKTDRKGQTVELHPRRGRAGETPTVPVAGAERVQSPSSSGGLPVPAAADPAVDQVAARVAGSLPVETEGRREPQVPVGVETIAAETEGSIGAAAPKTPVQEADTRRSAARPAEQADSSRFVQRAADAFAAMSRRGGVVRLRLHPPELGSLRVEITIKHGKLSARVAAETEAAKNLLVENLPALRERLAAQEIKLERFDVGVHDDSQRGAWERSDDGGLPRQERRQSSGWEMEINKAEDSSDAAEPWWRTDGGRLDVVI